MAFHLNLLHKSGGYFASILTISLGFTFVKVKKSILNISNDSFTLSEVALIFGQPIGCCEGFVSIILVSLGFYLFQNIDKVLEWGGAFLCLQQRL